MSRPFSGAPNHPTAATPGRTCLDTQAKRSFAERKSQKGGSQPTTPLTEGTNLMHPIDRPPPGDVARSATKTQSRPDLARQRSNLNFFEEAFSTTQPSPARARIHGDAIVMAEVKTNVIINDEFTFITELSYHLSTRYQRPISSVVVTLHHGACMFFAGSFDPAYVMAVYALPGQLLPTTNKRNAALIQKHMDEALGVDPGRGFLRFVPVPEECLVSGGRTVAGEVEEVERGNWEGGEVGVGARVRKRLSVKQSLARVRPPTPELTPPGSADGVLPRVLGSPGTDGNMKEMKLESPQRKAARRKKSFVASIFGRSGSRSGSRSGDRSPLATIVGED